MIRLLVDLQKIAAEDGTILAVRDGEVLRDGFGGTFEYQDDNTDADGGAIIGTAIIKPTPIGVNPGAWVRIPSKGDQNAQDIADIKNRLDLADNDISSFVEDSLQPYAKKIAALTPLTAAGTILRADALQKLGTITTDQAATMPPAASNTNKFLYIYVTNIGAGNWTANGQKLRKGHMYAFFSDGIIWIDLTNVNAQSTYFAPTGTATIQLINNCLNVVNSTGTITLTMPASPKQGDICEVSFPNALAGSSYTGGTVVQATSGTSAKSSRKYMYQETITSWV